jgi:hypothetical protein
MSLGVGHVEDCILYISESICGTPFTDYFMREGFGVEQLVWKY